MTDKLKDRAARCVTHHAACDCREYAYRERIDRLEGALRDMLSGWKYIRSFHGDLYGVGWDRAQQKAEEALADDAVGGDKSWMPEHGYDSFPDYTPRHGGDFAGTGGPLPGEPGNPNPSFAQMETGGRRDALEALARDFDAIMTGIRSIRWRDKEWEQAGPKRLEKFRRALTAPPTVPEAETELDDVKAWADGILGAQGTECADRVTDEEAILAHAIDRALAQHSEPGWIPEGYSEKLWAVHSALSDALGDSDVDWIESDEDLRTEEPIQWAAKEIANMLAPAPDADEREDG